MKIFLCNYLSLITESKTPGSRSSFFILTFGNFQSTFSHSDFKIRKYLSDVKSGEFLQWALWDLLGKLPELNNFSWGLNAAEDLS